MLEASPRGVRAAPAPLHSSLSLGVGQVLCGRYRLDALVGAAGGAVHLAGTDVTQRARVAIELCVGKNDLSGELRDRFLSAARKALALTSSKLTRTLDVGVTSEGHPYAVREHVDTPTLASILETHKSLPTQHAVDVALDVCEALRDAHAHGIVHGDLSPSGIHLVWSEDRVVDVKVLGFGTARGADAIARDALAALSLDALALRAPEQLQVGKTVDARADVWSVGAVLYRMLAGTPPFAAETPSSLCVSVKSDEPDALAGVPDLLAEIVESCLAKDAAARPKSISLLAAQLAAFGTRIVPPPASISSMPPPFAVALPKVVPPPVKRAPVVPPAEDTFPVLVVEPTFAAVIAREQPSALEIPIDLASAEKLPAPRLELSDESERDVAAKSSRTPPSTVMSTLAPPPTLNNPVRTIAIAAGAACLVFALVVGSQWSRITGRASSAPAPTVLATSERAPEPALVPPPVMMTSTPASELPNAATPVTAALPEAHPATPVTALAEAAPRPAWIVAGTHPAPAPAPAPTPKPAAKPANTAAPAPTVDPLVKAAAAPVSPQPKANDDDLRKFLDDRR